MDRDESPRPRRLTFQQNLALDLLSMDCGITNRELTSLLGKDECEEGNVLNNVIKPLLETGLIYNVKGKKYPKKLLYINKTRENMKRIRDDLFFSWGRDMKGETRGTDLAIYHLNCWIEKISDEIESGTLVPPKASSEKELEEARRERDQKLSLIKELLIEEEEERANSIISGFFPTHVTSFPFHHPKINKSIFDKAKRSGQIDAQQND